MIIGVTGTLASGKGWIADFFVDKGFKHYSVRKFLTDGLEKRGLNPTRDNLVMLGNELRVKFSPSYIAEALYEEAKKDGGDCIIESIRTPGEAEALKKKGNFYLIAVDANVKLRHERAVSRMSETDKIGFEDFVSQERREMHSEDPAKQNIGRCMEMADFIVINNGSLIELEKRVGEVFDEIKNKEKRPSWDEYFMEICNAVSKRATCDRGKSGCVIARDKRIIVTGYVGAPVGMPHCDEVGHQIKIVTHEDGTQTQHCLRTAHAEQNAICQAAKLGTSIDGATLYCKMTPCSACAKMIVNSGIKRVVCEKRYHAGMESEELFKQADVKLDIVKDEVEKYEGQKIN